MAEFEHPAESHSSSDTQTQAGDALLAKILTVSDGVDEGVREDRRGEALFAALTSYG